MSDHLCQKDFRYKESVEPFIESSSLISLLGHEGTAGGSSTLGLRTTMQEAIRSYIVDQNAKIAEEKKASKCMVVEAKEKVTYHKQQLQDETAKAVMSNGTSLSISDNEALVSKIKSEATKAHTELLEA
ncbi:zinc-finger of monoamine-oxidase A repressor R1 [Trifolium medium]|uniref:Zinc-finger of monoamine-oxidase A repressor R1 n=1 Tax=Trifolium medium TaxID=97028 RepID=A0A392PWM5_9FABA|nr:zinc-finger of monoamine-oxidase A repressor R1 [Trifolium medium]